MSELIQMLKSANFSGSLYVLWLSLATFLFSYYLEKRERCVLRGAVGIAIFALIGMAIPSEDTGMLGMGWYIACFWINACVVLSYCQVSWAEALQCALYGSLTEHLSSSVYVLMFVSKWIFNLKYTVILLVVYGAVWFLAARKMAHNGHYHVKWRMVLLVSILTILVVVVLSYLCKSTADPTATMNFSVDAVRGMLHLSQWYAIAFCVVMLAVELGRQQQVQAQLDLAASHELLRIHEQQYHLTRDNIDLINRKCHDMKHQIALLMEQQDGSEELRRRYSNEIIKMIEVYDSNINTGNEVLNTILRDKSLYCSMNNISWTCAAHGEQLDFMDPMDLAAMIGNALDNAVEAVERIADKKQQIISVQIADKGNIMQILVENTFDGKLNKAGGQILTRKDDKNYHGLGLRSIQAVAEKYDGYATTNVQGNTFVLNILIPIPKK